ncbi:MAG: winged helix-turn-helix transcriptional regulator [bacterium]|nr:winged helix-turn-helix transcriptional regulator [bacterium]
MTLDSNATSRLRRAIRVLVRRFALAERADVECCGVTVAQAATLEALLREGAMRSGDLGRLLGISPSTLSRNLNRLEDRGLIGKRPDPDDRRASQIILTDQGRTAALEVEQQEEVFAATVLGNLPDRQTATVLKSLDELLEAIRMATADCCGGAFEHLLTTKTQQHPCHDKQE